MLAAGRQRCWYAAALGHAQSELILNDLDQDGIIDAKKHFFIVPGVSRVIQRVADSLPSRVVVSGGLAETTRAMR